MGVLSEILLNEAGTEMHIELDQWRIADAPEAVHLASRYHENVARTRLKLLAIHGPAPAPFADELYLVIGMTVRPRSASWTAVKQKYRNADAALIGANEMMRAAPEWQIVLAYPMHQANAPRYLREWRVSD